MARKPRKRKAPAGCYWRGDVLYAQVRIKGETYRTSLRTDDGDLAGDEAKKWRDDIIKQVRFGKHRKTYETAFVEWGPYIKQNVSPKTAKRYGVSLGQLEPWLMPLFLDQVDLDLVGRVVAERQGAGVTNATLRRDLTALSSLLKFHQRHDNPALVWQKSLKERRDPIELPEPRDIRRVIERAPGSLASMIESAWKTGCREEELASALRPDLDHERRQLTVIGKGNKRRTIQLSDGAYRSLRTVPARLDCQWLFWHGKKVGRRYANVASRFCAIVKQVAEKCERTGQKFRPFRFHDLRHRYAVDWLKGGGSIYLLQQHLGHSSVKTTEIYLSFVTAEEAHHAKFGSQKSHQHQEPTLRALGEKES